MINFFQEWHEKQEFASTNLIKKIKKAILFGLTFLVINHGSF